MKRHIKVKSSEALAIPADGAVEADVDISLDGTVTVIEAHLGDRDITDIVTIETN